MASVASKRVLCSWNTIMLAIVGFLINLGSVTAFGDTNQRDFLRSLHDYEIVFPSVVTNDGLHISNQLHPTHSLRRRSLDFSVPEDQRDLLHYSVQIEDRVHVLRVQPNKYLVAPGLVIERRKNVYKNVTDSRFKWLHDDHKNCHYHGEVVNQTGTKVAIGVCNGLHGFIQSESGEFFIEPLGRADPADPAGHSHAVYRRSAMPHHIDPLQSTHLHKRSTDEEEDGSCGVTETVSADEARERWEKHHRRKRKAPTHRRAKRSVSTERYVETLVVVDPSMIAYHKNEHLETYVLTILNMVATMFHDASIGNSINIVLVRILLLEEDQEELVVTHHADKTLQSFCKFQKNINFKDDDHPNHHDVAILLTRKNICSRVDEPCGTLGLAQVSGMCQPHRSCSINEDTGLALAYTITHELGHNFGMHHDGYKNGCSDPPGRQLYIMAPSLIADSLPKQWSNCSMLAVTKFIDRDWGYCLNDEPVDHQYKFPVLPPGTMYDADHQCRLQYGSDDAEICTNEQDVCANLWCQSGNKCSTHLEAAAEGTICGTNMWCYEGRCVKIGDRAEAINGEWGEWSSWSECTRSCGAGVSHSQRFCENPRPSNGGKYCLGERKRYRLCNTENCPEDGVNFNQQQCADFNYIPYKKNLYEWDHVPTSETPCQLHCKPKNQFFSVMMKDIVTDGTPCMSGTRNMCISGRCRHVGCDYVIDSKVKEDRCGVCHGDGSTCKTVKSQYNETQGLGYVEATIIPVGARNIRIEEVAAANNFLALQNDKGEYYLNGHWFIQWSGDYKVAGTVVQYKRHGNMESVEAVGPLKEPLHVMLLLQSENPGLEFEYTVPKDNITEMRVPEFHWQYEAWTHCTASCGGGTQRSEVVCTEIEAGVVDDQYCDPSKKLDDKQRVCNEHLCPARWWVGPWQHCSATCGTHGSHQRTVICIRSLGPDEQIALDDEACAGEVKPAEVEPCHKKEPCPGNSTWLTGEWSSCNGNHCGLKFRKVWCENTAIGCEANEAPPSEMQCSDVVCGHWSAGEWSECTSTCGDGVQIRRVVCQGSDYCDVTLEPLSQRNCTLPPCEHHEEKAPTHGDEKTVSTTEVEVNSSIAKPDTATTTQVNEDNQIDRNNNSDVTEATGEENTDVSDPATEGLSNEGINETVQEEHTTQSEIQDKHAADNNKTETIPSENVDVDSQGRNDVEGTENNKENDEDTVSKYSDKNESEESDDINKDTSTIVSHDEDIKQEQEKEEVTTETDVDTDDTDDKIVEKSIEVEHKHLHKHRHHHGEKQKSKPDSMDESKTQEQNNTKENDTLTQSYEEIQPEDTTSEESVSDDKESESNDKNYVQPGILPVIPDKMPPLPNMEDLPPLPDKKLLAKVPPMKDLVPLPSLNNLPKYPSDITKEEKHNSEDKEQVGKSEIPKLLAVPNKADFPKLQNPNLKLPNLKDLKNLPKLEDLPPLPDLNKLPKKDPMLSLPKNMDLGALPKLEDLPPLPDIKDLPDKDLLPPLTVDVNPENAEEDNEVTESNVASINDNEIILDSNNNQVLPPETEIYKTSSVLNEPVSENTNNEINTDSVIDGENPTPNTLDVNIHGDSLNTVDDSENDILKETKKSSSKEIAVEETHDYTWKTSNWNECSRQCNRGVRTRTVLCIDGKSQTVDQSFCDINDKPTAIEDCNTYVCVEWKTSQWTECSATCGFSRKMRQVGCPEPGHCDPKEEPARFETCQVPDCVMWVSGQWSRCTQKCDGGEQVRLVQCVNLTSQLPSRGCDYSSKPQMSRACNTQACQNKNEALKIDCQHNEMSSVVCRALLKMGHCQKRFVSLKCCKTCGRDKRRKINKDRPHTHSLR